MSSKNTALTQEILTENLWRLMVTMSVPSIIGMSINGINAFVDALFVGRFEGEAALAAISLAFPLTMLTNGFTAMIGVGASSLLSIAIGSKDLDVQKKVFGTLTALSLIVSFILTVVCIYFARDLIAFMGGKGEILELGVEYYIIMMIGAVLRVFGSAANMLIRAEGKVKESMIMMIIATVLNIILNPIFIGHLGWGIAGAAWATVVAMGVLTLMDLWYYITKRASYTIDFSTYSLEKKLLSPILKVGVSAMTIQIMFFLQQLVVFRSLAHYGDDWDIAFMGACLRVVLLVILPCFGFSAALQPIIGINYGADKIDRVKKAFYVFTITNTLFVSAVFLISVLDPQLILGWMMPDSTFTEQDFFNFRMFLLTVPILPIFFMGTTLYQSVGYAKKAGFLVVAREILLYIPAVLILPLFFGVPGVYYASIPENVIAVIAAIWMVRREFKKWENKK